MLMVTVKLYGQVDRLVQPLVSSTMVGGYTNKGSGVSLPPNSYTYSDTGIFLDDDGNRYAQHIILDDG